MTTLQPGSLSPAILPQTPLAFPTATAPTPPPQNTETPAATPAAAPAPQDSFSLGKLSESQTNGAPHFTEYQVKRGETLSSIAQKLWGSSANYMDIYEANKDVLRNPNDLRVGMKLKIPTPPNSVDFPLGKPVEAPVSPAQPPASGGTSSAPPTSEGTPPAQPAAGSDAPPAAPPTSGTEAPAAPPAEPPPAPAFTEVTVKPGESLSILALRHLGDSERYMEIYEANKDQLRSPESVRQGMTLRIPTNTATPPAENPAAPAQNPATPAQNGTSPAEGTGTTNNVSETAPTDTEGMTPRARELYDALKNYQTYHNGLGHTNRTRTTDAELREIAIEADRAGAAFNVDPKIMLAVYAHESGGFNPRARSNTGAGGLGQLTGIAIRQVHYMAGMARGQRGREPFTQHRDNFIQSQTNIEQRYNIRQNIWTSTAYMAYEIHDRSRGNVERALGRYGDPNVSSYENKVNTEYRTLFGTALF